MWSEGFNPRSQPTDSKDWSPCLEDGPRALAVLPQDQGPDQLYANRASAQHTSETLARTARRDPEDRTVEVIASDVAFEMDIIGRFWHGKTNFATKLDLYSIDIKDTENVKLFNQLGVLNWIANKC